MKKSQRFFLPADDVDVSLVKAQMSQQFVHGLGFCGSAQGATIDPAEIVGNTNAVRDEHRKVLLKSLGK